MRRRTSSNVCPGPRAFCSPTYASQTMVAQTSPALCTSEFGPPGSVGGPTGSGSPSEMWRNVSAFFVKSTEYGTRRMPK